MVVLWHCWSFISEARGKPLEALFRIAGRGHDVGPWTSEIQNKSTQYSIATYSWSVWIGLPLPSISLRPLLILSPDNLLRLPNSSFHKSVFRPNFVCIFFLSYSNHLLQLPSAYYPNNQPPCILCTPPSSSWNTYETSKAAAEAAAAAMTRTTTQPTTGVGVDMKGAHILTWR
jgi:hypothetical protein